MRTKRLIKHDETGAGIKLVLFSALCILFCLAIASAQPAGEATMKKFNAHLEYFPPPHELQVKSDLEGAEAEPHGENLILVHDAKLQTYYESGAPEMTITTPQCFFNINDKTVNSAGPIQVTSDNKLLKGEGFLWRQSDSVLLISNRVDSIMRGPLTNSFKR